MSDAPGSQTIVDALTADEVIRSLIVDPSWVLADLVERAALVAEPIIWARISIACAEARADERERIAQAIEAREGDMSPVHPCGDSVRAAFHISIRIARNGGSDR